MKYPLFKVHIPKKDAIWEIEKVIDSGYINEGEQVTVLGQKLESYLRVKNLVLTNAGTSALTLALRVAGVSRGDEVISVSMTCIASNTPIINLGAKIVWADIDPMTGSIDANEVRKLITPRTKAIMFVAWAGNPCDLAELGKIGKDFGIPLIQDAAHAFGADWNGESISNWADFTCYSFQAIKHFTTGDGGAIVCRNNKDYLLAKKLKWFGYDRDAVKDSKGDWKGQRWDADIFEGEVGYKFNMNNLSAAIGLSQFNYIDGILQSHRRNAQIIADHLVEAKVLRALNLPTEAKSSNWVLTMLYDGSEDQRNVFLEKLNEKGVGAGLVHLPNHPYSAFKEFHRELKGTEMFSRKQISIPCGWWLSEEDCVEMCQILLKTASEI